MTRTTLAAVLAGVGLGLFGALGQAQDQTEVKLTGTLVCGKCTLKATPKCSNALRVTEGDRLVTYFLADRGNKEAYHEPVCGDGQVPGVTVTGTVTERDGKKWVTVTTIDLPRK